MAADAASQLTITVDAAPLRARAGESVATALMAADRLMLRRSPRAGAPRGAFCLMGVCQECVVRIDGVRRQACLVEVRDGMAVETGA